jgi:nitronate monooxygenase
MSRRNEAVSRLGIEHPIIQGPFGGGLSTPRLVAAVSNLGGFGSFGAYHLAPDAIGPLAAEIRALTAKPFALNLWVSDHDEGGEKIDQAEFDRIFEIFRPYFRELDVEKPAMPARYGQRFADQVEALIDAAPPAFSFVFGIPGPDVLARCKKRDIVTIGAATSIAEAEALEDAGIDLIVATGFDAGGHRPSFLARAEDSLMGTFALTQLVSRCVKAPVIAAGGIADGRGVRAALALGAQAAQIGTAFLACEESGATPEHRAALFSAKAERTALTRAFSGRLARGLRNRWVEEMAGRAAELAPFPIQSWFMSQLRPAAAKAGRTDLVSLWSGQIAPNLKHRRAGELMRAMIEETAIAEAAL